MDFVPLGWALTGEQLDVDVGADLEDLAALFTSAGWPVERIRALREQRIAAELPWPFPLPSGVLGDGGRAQFQALLQRAIGELGLRTVARPSGRTALTGDERRLLADRPPHW